MRLTLICTSPGIEATMISPRAAGRYICYACVHSSGTSLSVLGLQIPVLSYDVRHRDCRKHTFRIARTCKLPLATATSFLLATGTAFSPGHYVTAHLQRSVCATVGYSALQHRCCVHTMADECGSVSRRLAAEGIILAAYGGFLSTYDRCPTTCTAAKSGQVLGKTNCDQ